MMKLARLIVVTIALTLGITAGAGTIARAQTVPLITPPPVANPASEAPAYVQPQGAQSAQAQVAQTTPTSEATPDPSQVVQQFYALKCDANSALSNGIDVFVGDVTQPGVQIGQNSYKLGMGFFAACGGLLLVLFIYRFGHAFNIEEFFTSGGGHIFFLLMVLAFITYASGVHGGASASVQAESGGDAIASRLLGHAVPANVGTIVGTGVCRAWQIVSVPMLAEMQQNPIQNNGNMFDVKAQFGNMLTLMNYFMVFVLALIPALFALLAHLVLAIQKFMLHINAYLVAPAAVFTVALAVLPIYKDNMPKYMGVLYLIVVSEVALILDLGVINKLFDWSTAQIVDTIQVGSQSGLVLRLIELDAISVVALGLAIGAPQFAKVFVGQLGEFGTSFAAAGFLGTAVGAGAMAASLKLAGSSVSAIGNAVRGALSREDHDVKVHGGGRAEKSGSRRDESKQHEQHDSNVDAEAKHVEAPSHDSPAVNRAGDGAGEGTAPEHEEAPASSGSIFDTDHIATMQGEAADEVAVAGAEGAAATENASASMDASSATSDRDGVLVGTAVDTTGSTPGTERAPTAAANEADMRLNDAIEAVAAGPASAASIRELQSATNAAQHRPSSQRTAMAAVSTALHNSAGIAPATAGGRKHLASAQTSLGSALRSISTGDHASAKRHLQSSERSLAAIAASPQSNDLTKSAAGETLQSISSAYQAVGMDHVESLRATPMQAASTNSPSPDAAQTVQPVQAQHADPPQSAPSTPPESPDGPRPQLPGSELAADSIAGLTSQLKRLEQAFERSGDQRSGDGQKNAQRRQGLRDLRQRLERVFEHGSQGWGSLTPPSHHIEHPHNSIPRKPSK